MSVSISLRGADSIRILKLESRARLGSISSCSDSIYHEHGLKATANSEVSHLRSGIPRRQAPAVSETVQIPYYLISVQAILFLT